MTESRINRIREAVESRSEELVGLLESFVAIPSENPPGSHLRDAQAWIGDRLTDYDIPFESHSTSRTGGDQAGAIDHVVQDQELQNDLSQRGRARAAQFSWQRTAQRTTEIFRTVTDQ